MSGVNVFDKDGKTIVSQVQKPGLFDVELRDDLVKIAHDCVRQNRRQPYAVSPSAGKQHSAESWGTGRAMARVPRVKASGTRRAGQAAFANFARKGRMAHPTKTHRRWHRKTPLTLRRQVTLMGVAASANGAIVEGRGHVIKDVASLPLVVSDAISGLTKTRDAVEMLKNLKLGAELQKVKDSKTITCGKGKFRGRRYTRKTGLLLVHDQKSLPAFANIEGVELANVEHLNLLRLCPGGKLGRLILWTEGAFKRLESLFSNESKRGFEIPEKMVSCSDLDEYFYSPEIQSLITTPDLLPKGTCKKSAAEKKSVERAIAMW